MYASKHLVLLLHNENIGIYLPLEYLSFDCLCGVPGLVGEQGDTEMARCVLIQRPRSLVREFDYSSAVKKVLDPCFESPA